jgi:hypothetical protein
MASYHLSAQEFSRGAGHSSVHAAAYRARCELVDERTGLVHDYGRKGGELLFEGIYAPKDAPEWAHDRAQLWNHVEAFEKHRRALLAREFNIALPHELTLEQNRYALQDWIRDNFTRKGLIADAVIHAPSPDGDQRNVHAHVMVVMRKLDGSEFARTKERFETYTEKDAARKAELEALRESWERIGNRHLERHGHAPTLDRRTLLEQGADREPTVHLGKAATAIERGGQASELGTVNREITARNVIDLAAARAERAAQGRRDGIGPEPAPEAGQAPEPVPGIEAPDAATSRAGGPEQGLRDAREEVTTNRRSDEFAEALGKTGLTLARVTDDDIKALDALRQAEHVAGAAVPEYKPRYFPELAQGQLVTVDRSGDVRWIARDRLDDVRQLADAQPHLPSVIEAREAAEIKGEQRTAFIDEQRAARAEIVADRTAARVARSEAKEADREIRDAGATVENETRKTIATAEQGVDKATRGFGRILGALAKPFEKVIGFIADMIAPTAPPTRDQAERMERVADEQQQEAAATAAQRQDAAAKDWQILEQNRQQQQGEQDRYSRYSGALTRGPDDPRERDTDRGRERER